MLRPDETIKFVIIVIVIENQKIVLAHRGWPANHTHTQTQGIYKYSGFITK